MTDGGATIRVATYNIRAAIGPGPFPDRWWERIDADRLRAIGVAVSRLDADLVALQEVAVCARDGELVDNAGDLARQLGMEVRYAAVRTFDVADGDGRPAGTGLFGNALLSRLTLTDARGVALPMAAVDDYVEPPGADHRAAGIRYRDAPDDIREPRCLLLATAELPGGGRLRVGSAHLSHIGSGERALQAAAVASAFGAALPALLLGDLNAAIESGELAALSDGWSDAFAAAGIPPGDARRVSTEDGWRIDHVLARGATTIGCRVVTEAGDLSDHYPVVADLRLG